MESLFQSGSVVETSTAFHTSYIISNNEDFLMTEYKVLKTKVSAGLIKCSKLLYNGKIKLVYFTNGLKPLNTLWHSMDDDSCIRVLTNLFNTAIELKNNGFLNCHNLVISENRIFVDVNTHSVYLVYLPVSNPNWDTASFESDLRSRVLKALTANNKLITGRMSEIGSLLTNGILTMEEVYRHMCMMCKGGTRAAMQETSTTPEPVREPEHIWRQSEELVDRRGVDSYARLVSMDSFSPLTLQINRAEYRIGKNPSLVDGAITFNKAISRVHCQISSQNGAYYLTDLGSANGTYVNKVRVAPNQRMDIKNGDVIRLANSDFEFKVGGV